MNSIVYKKLGNHVFVTKLAGFEHTRFIQGKATKHPKNITDIPMVQGKNIQNGVFKEEYEWYIDKNISNSLIRSVLDKKCILIPYVGSNLGEVGVFYHPYDCHLSSNIAKLEIMDDKFDLEYLKYYLQSDIGQKYLFQNKQGSAQPNITMESIRQTLIIYRNKDKQKELIKPLLLLDQKIQLNNKIISELEKMVKTIYDYWFVQFDFPNEDGKPYRQTGGEMVYNQNIKREIPKGWKVNNFSNNMLFNIIKPGVDAFDKKIYLATADVNETNISKGNIISYDTRESRANMQPTINSVWFAKMKNSVKHLFLNKEMKYLVDNTILSTGFCGLQCTEISFEYVCSFISNKSFEIKKNSLAHGATQEAVNNTDLSNINVIVPDNNILKNFHIKTNQMYGLMSNCRKENIELTKIRDWLLPILMNGQALVE